MNYITASARARENAATATSGTCDITQGPRADIAHKECYGVTDISPKLSPIQCPCYGFTLIWLLYHQIYKFSDI